MPGLVPVVLAAALLGVTRPVTPTTPAGRTPVDPKDVAARITALAGARAQQLGVKSAKAECPKPFVAKSATIVYQCTVLFEGLPVPYLVRLDGVGAPTIEAMAVVHTSRALAARVASSLSPSQPGAKVDCGAAKLVVRAVGATVDCRVTLGAGRKATATVVPVRLLDADGGIALPGQSRSTA